MTNLKVFRVTIIEQQGFHVDVLAENAAVAMSAVRRRLHDPADAITPIADSYSNTGFQVEDATEIDPQDADLE